MAMNIDALGACDRLVTAAVNGVWQGIIITVLVGVSLRLLRRTNAATRHAIWFSTLLLLVFLIPFHCLRDSFMTGLNKNQAEAEIRGHDHSLAPSIKSSSLPNDAEMVAGPIESKPAFAEPQWISNADAAVEETETAASPPLPASNSIKGVSETEQVARQATPSNETATPESARRLILAAGTQIPRLTSAVLLSLWVLVALSGLLCMARRFWHLRELKQSSSSPAGELNQFFRNLCEALGVRRKVELRIVASRQSPLLAGFIRPMILFPIELARVASRPQAEQILRHELAHLQRRDDWVNLVQQCIQAVFFFHPSVWWISRQLSLEREIACDDHVVQLAGRARSYALLLANLAAWTNKRPLMLASGVSNNKSQLQQRINMILDTHRNISPRLVKARLGVIASISAAVAALAIYAAPRIVLAQSAAPEPAAVPGEPPSADNAPLIAAVEESGPRYKSEAPGDVPAPPPVAIPGTPAPSGLPPTPPVPALPARRSVTPRPALAPGGFRHESSIEERLARLEEMVRELMAQRDPKHANFDLRLKRGPDEAAIMELKEMEKMKAMKDMEKIKDFAKREAARAAEQAKRATKEIEKTRKLDAERRHSQRGEALGKQLETLEKQRETLERQMEKLQHQIEELQQSQEQLDEDLNDEQDLLNEIGKEDCEKEVLPPPQQ